MNSRRDPAFLLAFAITLWLMALWLGLQEPLLFRLKQPGGAFLLLSGWRQWLVAAAPALAGCTLALAARRALAGGTLNKESVRGVEVFLFLAGLVAFSIAVVTAPRV